jgi:hypothetical protein
MALEIDEATMNYYGGYIAEGKSILYNTILSKLSSLFDVLEFSNIESELNEYKYIVNTIILAGYKLINHNYDEKTKTCNIKFAFSDNCIWTTKEKN